MLDPLPSHTSLCETYTNLQTLLSYLQAARVSVVDGDVHNLVSDPLPNQKAAKASAAMLALKALVGVQGLSLVSLPNLGSAAGGAWGV